MFRFVSTTFFVNVIREGDSCTRRDVSSAPRTRVSRPVSRLRCTRPDPRPRPVRRVLSRVAGSRPPSGPSGPVPVPSAPRPSPLNKYTVCGKTEPSPHEQNGWHQVRYTHPHPSQLHPLLFHDPTDASKLPKKGHFAFILRFSAFTVRLP